MLGLVVLTIGLIIGTGMMGFGFSRFMAHRSRAQSKVDAEALSIASGINQGNRVGLLNEFELCSRELVFVSHMRHEKCQQEEDSGFLAPLCYQFLTEAREGHMLLEQERENQIHQISREIQQSVQEYNWRADGELPFEFCWPTAGQPHIDGVSVGNIRKVASNVKDLSVIKELSEHDRSAGYVDTTTNLYKAEINAKLPVETDLDFYISSLPANVEGSCSPARNANPDVFSGERMIVQDGKPADEPLHFLPSAVQLFSSINASAGENTSAKVNLVSTGVTNGDSMQK